MKIGRPFACGAVPVLLILLPGLTFLHSHAFAQQPRSYRIGWEDDPPNQVDSHAAEPTGLAIEVVREAARRRHISLTWIRKPEGPDSALASKSVDLWPIMRITPERRKLIYLSDPYQEDHYQFVTDRPDDWEQPVDPGSGTVAYQALQVNERILKSRFPHAQLLPKPTVREAIAAVCNGESRIAFGEQYTILSVFVHDSPCPSKPLEIVPSNVSTELGIGANLENRAIARQLRDEIGKMAEDGTLRKIVPRWLHVSGRDLESMTTLPGIRRRLWTDRVEIIILGALLAFALWAATGFRRERNRSKAADEALLQAERRLRLLSESRAEEAIQKKHALLNAVVEGTGDAVFIKDLAGRYVLVNAVAAEMFGRPPASIPGRDDSQMLPPALAQAIMDNDREIMRSGVGQKVEEAITDAMGHHRTFLSTKSPWRNEQGEILGIIGIATDITERKQLEAKFLQAQKLDAIGRLAGGVAHDFNNLLSVISSSSFLLKESLPPDNREALDFAEEIETTAIRAAGLTRQLLAFSRREVVEPRVLDCNTVVRDFEKMLRRLIGEDIDLILHLAPNLGRIKADPAQIEQVLLNLAVNARDAMPNGGALVIQTVKVHLSDPLLMGPRPEFQPGDHVELSVTDTGTGMDAEVRTHLFEPFFTTKPRDRGTGLGLSTVFSIVKQSGGDISVASEVGKGTTFNVYLPVVQAAVTSGTHASGAPGRPGAETILLVEDEQVVRRMAAIMLRRLGYNVTEARNAGHALELFQAHPFDLVLTDLIMPGMSGVELGETLLEISPHQRILYMTGYTDDLLAAKVLRTRNCTVLQKPFTAATLGAQVRGALTAGRPSPTLVNGPSES